MHAHTKHSLLDPTQLFSLCLDPRRPHRSSRLHAAGLRKAFEVAAIVGPSGDSRTHSSPQLSPRLDKAAILLVVGADLGWAARCRSGVAQANAAAQADKVRAQKKEEEEEEEEEEEKETVKQMEAQNGTSETAGDAAEATEATPASQEGQEEEKVAEVEETGPGPLLERAFNVPKEGYGFATFCLEESSLATDSWGTGDSNVPFFLFNPFASFAAEPGNVPERWETSYSLLLARV